MPHANAGTTAAHTCLRTYTLNNYGSPSSLVGGGRRTGFAIRACNTFVRSGLPARLAFARPLRRSTRPPAPENTSTQRCPLASRSKRPGGAGPVSWSQPDGGNAENIARHGEAGRLGLVCAQAGRRAPPPWSTGLALARHRPLHMHTWLPRSRQRPATLLLSAAAPDLPGQPWRLRPSDGRSGLGHRPTDAIRLRGRARGGDPGKRAQGLRRSRAHTRTRACTHERTQARTRAHVAVRARASSWPPAATGRATRHVHN